MTLTKEQRIARHKQFLNANWQLLAAFSWEHYKQQGRGAVIADERDFVTATIPQFAAIKLRYVADGSPILAEIGGWPGDKEAGWVKSYDPDARVVVLIVRDGGGTSGYMVGGTPKPSEVYAREKAKRN
jgi:hypothetical protein